LRVHRGTRGEKKKERKRERERERETERNGGIKPDEK